MSDAERHVYVERLYKCVIPPEKGGWQLHDQSMFQSIGAPLDSLMFNTGVMVLSPGHHADLLRSIYDKDHDSRLYEQPFLSAEICSRGIAQVISARFNWSVHEILMLGFAELPVPPITLKHIEQLLFVLRNEMKKAYFLHFCGSMPLMSLLYQAGIHSLEEPLPEPGLTCRGACTDHITAAKISGRVTTDMRVDTRITPATSSGRLP